MTEQHNEDERASSSSNRCLSPSARLPSLSSDSSGIPLAKSLQAISSSLSPNKKQHQTASTRFATSSTQFTATTNISRRRSSLAASPAVGGLLSNVAESKTDKLFTRHSSLATNEAAAVAGESEEDDIYRFPGNLLVIAEDEADEQQAVDDFNQRILMRQRLATMSSSTSTSNAVTVARPVSPLFSSTGNLNNNSAVVAKAKRRFSLMKESLFESNSSTSGGLLAVPETEPAETLLSEQCPPSIQYAAAHARRRFSLPAQQLRDGPLFVPPTRAQQQQQQQQQEHNKRAALPVFKGKNDILDFSAFAKLAKKHETKSHLTSTSSHSRGRRISIANFSLTENELSKRPASPTPPNWHGAASDAGPPRTRNARKLSLLGEQLPLLPNEQEASEFSLFPISHKLSALVQSNKRSSSSFSRFLPPASNNLPKIPPYNKQPEAFSDTVKNFPYAPQSFAGAATNAAHRRRSLAHQHRQHAFQISHNRYASMQQRDETDSPKKKASQEKQQRTLEPVYSPEEKQQRDDKTSRSSSSSSTTSSADTPVECDEAEEEDEETITNRISISNSSIKVNTTNTIHQKSTAAPDVSATLDASEIDKQHITTSDASSLLFDNPSFKQHKKSNESSPTFNSARLTTANSNKFVDNDGSHPIERENVNDDSFFITQPYPIAAHDDDGTKAALLLSLTTLTSTTAAAAALIVLNNNPNNMNYVRDTSAHKSAVVVHSTLSSATRGMTFEITGESEVAVDTAPQSGAVAAHPEQPLYFLSSSSPTTGEAVLTTTADNDAAETLPVLQVTTNTLTTTNMKSDRHYNKQEEKQTVIGEKNCQPLVLLTETINKPVALLAAGTPESGSNTCYMATESRLTTPTTHSHVASTASSFASSSSSSICSSPTSSSRFSSTLQQQQQQKQLPVLINTTSASVINAEQQQPIESGTTSTRQRREHTRKKSNRSSTALLTDGERTAKKSQHDHDAQRLGTATEEAARVVKSTSLHEPTTQKQQLDGNSASSFQHSTTTTTADMTTKNFNDETAEIRKRHSHARTDKKSVRPDQHHHHHSRKRRRQKRRVESERSLQTSARHVRAQHHTLIDANSANEIVASPQIAAVLSSKSFPFRVSSSPPLHCRRRSSSSATENELPNNMSIKIERGIVNNLSSTNISSAAHRQKGKTTSFESFAPAGKRVAISIFEQKRVHSVGDTIENSAAEAERARIRPRFRKRHTDPFHFIRSVTEERALREQQLQQQQQQQQQQQSSTKAAEAVLHSSHRLHHVAPVGAACSAPTSPQTRQRSKSSSDAALVSSASATNELYSIEEHQQDASSSHRDGGNVCHAAALAILHRSRRKSFSPSPAAALHKSRGGFEDNSGRDSPADANNSANSMTSASSDTPPWMHGLDRRFAGDTTGAKTSPSPPSQAVLRRKRHSIIVTGRTRPATTTKTTTTATTATVTTSFTKQQQQERVVREANKKAAQSRSVHSTSSSYFSGSGERAAAFALTHAFTDPGASTSIAAADVNSASVNLLLRQQTEENDEEHASAFDFSAEIAAAIANAAARTATGEGGGGSLLDSSNASSRRNSTTLKRHSVISTNDADADSFAVQKTSSHQSPSSTLRSSAATSRRRQSLVRYSEVVDEEVIEATIDDVGKSQPNKTSNSITSANVTAAANNSSDEREDQLRAISPTIEHIARAKIRGKRLSLPFLRSDAAFPYDTIETSGNYKHAFAERSTGVVGQVKPDLAITRQAPFFVWRLNDSERFHHEIVDENLQGDNGGTGSGAGGGGSGDRSSSSGQHHHLSLILKQSSSTSASGTTNDFYDSSTSRRGSQSDKSESDRRSSVQSADGGRRVHHHHHRHHHHQQRASLSDVSSGNSSRRRSSAGLSVTSACSDVDACSSLSSSRRSSLINWWHRRKSWTLQPFTSGSGGVSLSVSRRSSASNFSSRRTSSLSSFSGSFLFGFRSAGGTSSEEGGNMEEGYPESGDAKCTCTYCSRQRRFSDQSYLHKPPGGEAMHSHHRTHPAVLDASNGGSAESSNQSHESPANNIGLNQLPIGGKERSFSLRIRTTQRNAAGCASSTSAAINGFAATTIAGPMEDEELQLPPTVFLQPGKTSNGRHKSWDASMDSNFFQSPELRFYEAVCGKLQQIGLMAADAAGGVVPSAISLSRRAPSITSLIASTATAAAGSHQIHSSHSFNAALSVSGNNDKSKSNQLSSGITPLLLPITQRRKFSCFSPITTTGDGARVNETNNLQPHQHDSLLQQRRRSHTYNFQYTEYKTTRVAAKAHSSPLAPPVAAADPSTAAAPARETPAKHENSTTTASSYLFPSQVDNVRLLDRFHRWTLTNLLNTVLHSAKGSTKSIASQELFGTEVSVKDKSSNQTPENNGLLSAGAVGKRGSWFVDSVMNWFDSSNHAQSENQVVLKQRNLLTEGLTLEQIFTIGTLFLTETNLIFVSIPAQAYERWILYSLIDNVEQLPETTFGFPIRVRCKHFLTTTFLVSDKTDAAILHTAIQKLSKPSNIRRALTSSCSVPPATKANKATLTSESGPFNMGSEYERLGLPNADWKVAALNWDYQLCSTYPKLLVVPSMAEQTILRGSALFRKHKQLPVLTFYSERTGGCLIRGAEPIHKKELSSNAKFERSPEDETLLNCVKNCSAASVNTNRLYLFDIQCSVKPPAPGPGFKGILSKQWLSGKHSVVPPNKAKFYIKEDFSLTTLHAETLDATRVNLECLNDACDLNLKPRPENATLPPMLAYTESIRESGWLQSMHNLLNAACSVATRVNDGYSVILQAADLDRIAQVGSLAQLLLDPHYRTTEGFLALLAKDWLAFGYPFEHRCGRKEEELATPSSQPPHRSSKVSNSSPSQQGTTPITNSGSRKDRNTNHNKQPARSLSTANTPEIFANGPVAQRKKFRKHKSSSQRSQLSLKSTDTPPESNSLLITESPNMRNSISASASPLNHRPHINRIAASSREYVTDNSDEEGGFPVKNIGSAHSGIELHIASTPDESAASSQVSPKTVRCTSFGSRRSRRRVRQNSSRSSKSKTSPSQQLASSNERDVNDRVAAAKTFDNYKITTPTLTQFFDCVYQLMQQLPFEFKFNERFLIDLHEAVYSGQYNEFWGNCERERLAGGGAAEMSNGLLPGPNNENTLPSASIAAREPPTKSYVNTVLRKRYHNYVNPLTSYLALTTNDPVQLEPNHHMLNVDLSPQSSLEMFNSLYFRFESGVHERESLDECVALLTEQCDSLQRHVALLENQLKIVNDHEISSVVESRRSSSYTAGGMLARTLNSAAAAMNIGATPAAANNSTPAIDANTTAASLRGMASRWWTGETPGSSNAAATAQQVNTILRNRIADYGRPKTVRQQSSVVQRPAAPLPSNVLQLLVSPIVFDYVALTFQSIRAIVDGKCDCQTSFNNINRKYYCMACGRIICKRCVQQVVLPGHAPPAVATLASISSRNRRDGSYVTGSNAVGAVNTCSSCNRTVTQLKVAHKNAAIAVASMISRGKQQSLPANVKLPPQQRPLPSLPIFNGSTTKNSTINHDNNLVKPVRPGSFVLASKLSVLNELLNSTESPVKSGESNENMTFRMRSKTNEQVERKWSTGSNASEINGRRSPSTLNRQTTASGLSSYSASSAATTQARFSVRSPSTDARASVGGGSVLGNVVRRFQTLDASQPQKSHQSFSNSTSTRGGSLIPYGAVSPGSGRSPSPHSPSGSTILPSSSSFKQGLLSLSTYYGDLSPYGSRKTSTASMTQDDAMKIASAAAAAAAGAYRSHSAVSSTYSNASVNSGEHTAQYFASNASTRHGSHSNAPGFNNSSRINGHPEPTNNSANQRGRIVMDNIFYR